MLSDDREYGPFFRQNKNTCRKELNDPFLLLGQLFSPWNSDEKIANLITEIGRQSLWEPVIVYALQQWCSPFLYEQIRQYAQECSVPIAIKESLKTHCLTNRIRNSLFRKTLLQLTTEFRRRNIKVLLLKGAATFADDLYRVPGARAMIDIDLLVRREQITRAQQILVDKGFVENVDPGKVFDGLPMDARHAHVNDYYKPGTPVVVEMHYNVAYGQGGRILPSEIAWRNTGQVYLDNESVLILSPTFRLIHNTVHGLIPSCDFIKGEIRFFHLLEFGFLVKRYGSEICWRKWLEVSGSRRMRQSFLAYLYLAHCTLNMPWPKEINPGILSRTHGRRLALTGRYLSKVVTGNRASPFDFFLFSIFRLYYFCMLPNWVWQNVCYAEGVHNLPIRLQMLVKKSLSKKSRKKIL